MSETEHKLPEEKQPEEVSVLRNARSMQEKADREAKEKELARQAAEAEAQYQAREEYAKTLQEEKVELIRMKQGEEFDHALVYGKQEEQRKYSLGEKIGNWLYHAKWWLGIAVFVVFIAGFLIYDRVTRVDPDIRVLILSEQSELFARSFEMDEYLTPLTDDFNEDGKNIALSVYVPTSENSMEYSGAYAATYNSQLMMQFQTNTCMLVISDDDAEQYLDTDMMFVDLHELYPDCKFIDGYKLMLNQTDFGEKIGMVNPFKDGAYLALRTAVENMNSLEENQAAQARAKAVLDKLIPELHENKNPLPENSV